MNLIPKLYFKKDASGTVAAVAVSGIVDAVFAKAGNVDAVQMRLLAVYWCQGGGGGRFGGWQWLQLLVLMGWLLPRLCVEECCYRCFSLYWLLLLLLLSCPYCGWLLKAIAAIVMNWLL